MSWVRHKSLSPATNDKSLSPATNDSLGQPHMTACDASSFTATHSYKYLFMHRLSYKQLDCNKVLLSSVTRYTNPESVDRGFKKLAISWNDIFKWSVIVWEVHYIVITSLFHFLYIYIFIDTPNAEHSFVN